MKKIFLFLTTAILIVVSAKAESTPVNLINEDYVWVYFSVLHYNTHTDMYYKYSGTKEIAGKTYHRYVNYKNEERKWTPENDITETVYEGFEKLVWLAREEDRKLIVIYPSDIESEEYTEYVVNDFNLQKGDLVSDCPYYHELHHQEWIHDIDYVEIEGKNCMIQWTDPDRLETGPSEYWRPIVEGVGNCGVGLHENLQVENNGDSGNWFSRLEDKDGKVLLDRETIFKLNPAVGIVPVPDMDFSGSGIEFTNGKVSCRTSDGAEISLAVYHPDGRLVAEISENGEVSLSTSILDPGVYVVRASVDNRSASRKIIIR